jgi:hypothetical protein
MIWVADGRGPGYTRGKLVAEKQMMNDSTPHMKSGRVGALRPLIALLSLVMALVPQPSQAAGCADWLQKPLRATGTYYPAEEAYARSFVFAMLFDCNGSQVTVTVQRPTGRLPVCEAQQQVEVVGTLSVSSKLIGSYYQINDPTSVTCLAVARAGPSGAQLPAAAAPVQAGPAPRAETPRAEALRAEAPSAGVPSAQAKTLGSSAWVGRYTDNRGTGDITLTLMRGESTVSGTWKMRTGGGGPLTGIVEPNAGRVMLRLENIAAECPGLLEGTAEMSDTTFTATYQGKDCQGPVTGGRLELRPQ